VASSEVETRGYGVADNAGAEPDSGAEAHGRHDHQHDEQHEHAHAHEHEAAEDDHAHAAFRVEAVIRCDGAKRMRWLAIDLFERFPDNRSLRLDVLSESGAASHRLDRDDFRIRFD
jgi:ABC-type Zn2+ transport system substrate-binding protein/surface adhesin